MVVAGTADALNMDNLAIVRAAAPTDLESLSSLKEEWAGQAAPATAVARAEFVRTLERWMDERGESDVCLVAELEGSHHGMACLMTFEGVRFIRVVLRRSGDIHCVFVRPEFRGAGVGRQLISGLVGVADEMGIPRVTVSANSRAASLYESQGFVATPTLLERPARTA